MHVYEDRVITNTSKARTEEEIFLYLFSNYAGSPQVPETGDGISSVTPALYSNNIPPVLEDRMDLIAADFEDTILERPQEPPAEESAADETVVEPPITITTKRAERRYLSVP